ncbi:MAG: hypothetical protein NZ602_11895 [Thermoguttaceae bacterium]|nr:hypothetical protein [Thermoguttaceae bacterium]MDW8039551.1 hypothetical protein [Thermoguttaceae bacterium]
MLRIGWGKPVGVVCLAVGLVLVGGIRVWAAEESGQTPKTGPIIGAPKPPEGMYYLPAPYWSLSRPEIQKELELLPDQVEKLKELSKRYWEQQQELYKGIDWAKMMAEERSAKWKELSERMQQQREEIRKEVEKILMPAQIAALKDIHFRQYASGYLWGPQIAEKIGLTEDQKTQLNKLRQEYQEKQMQLMRELIEKQLNVLTPEQKEKLKEEIQKWMRF